MKNPPLEVAITPRIGINQFRGIKRSCRVMVAIAVFLALLGLTSTISPYPLSYFDISFVPSGGTTTALAAMGQTLVILSGGFDLSAGAVVSLVNAVLASQMDPSNFDASVPLWTLIGIAVGMSVGAFNGSFIALLRLQPIVVTLATMFIVQGFTLLVMDKPGVFVSAQTGSGDPLVGNWLLLTTFAAVVLGGTRLSGGIGGLVGSVFGAYILIIVVNILLSLNVSAHYSIIGESAVLLLAVLAGSVSADNRLPFARLAAAPEALRPSFLVHSASTLRYTLPAFVCLLLVLATTQAFLGNVFTSFHYWDALLVPSMFLAILALGQGSVILTGGADLSLPWMIGLSGILVAGIVQGADGALLYAIPIVIIVAKFVGFLNGLGVVALGLSPIVVILAMNGLLQGAALVYSDGTPAGFAAPALRWIMTVEIIGITPIIPALAAFVVLAILLFSRTPFGRRLYAIGNSEEAAILSGVKTAKTLISVYFLSPLPGDGRHYIDRVFRSGEPWNG